MLLRLFILLLIQVRFGKLFMIAPRGRSVFRGLKQVSGGGGIVRVLQSELR